MHIGLPIVVYSFEKSQTSKCLIWRRFSAQQRLWLTAGHVLAIALSGQLLFWGESVV